MKNKIKTSSRVPIYLLAVIVALSYFFFADNFKEEEKSAPKTVEGVKEKKTVNSDKNKVDESYEDDKTKVESASEENLEYEQCEVDRVVDGDTVIIYIDGKKQRVRLSGVDTPESVGDYEDNPEFYGKEASKFTKENLEGATVYLEFDEKKYDKYDRMLAYVWTEVPNENFNGFFNLELIEKGYAEWYNDRENKKYAERFRELEDKARAEKLGLWAR